MIPFVFCWDINHIHKLSRFILIEQSLVDHKLTLAQHIPIRFLAANHKFGDYKVYFSFIDLIISPRAHFIFMHDLSFRFITRFR